MLESAMPGPGDLFQRVSVLKSLRVYFCPQNFLREPFWVAYSFHGIISTRKIGQIFAFYERADKSWFSIKIKEQIGWESITLYLTKT
mmetsp:Transcript_48370/g.136044  ORF Transcript_48370/g.136044 Transcript_48370/m.136044 type:complete len:87 (-) Transcript_48370:201-461(-)